jgi:hypothetical protein
MITIEIKKDGVVVGILVADEKEFKTGSRGYYTNGKVAIDGKRYQANIQLVEIGSKNKEKEDEVNQP